MRIDTLLSVVCISMIALPSALAADRNSLPDFSGQWGRNLMGYEPPPSGPGPVMRGVRNADGSVAPAAQCCGVVTRWFGDPDNPVLRPVAADAVRKYREMGDAGVAVPDLHNGCWPEPPPFAMALNWGVHILQTKNEVVVFYLLYNTVRHVRLNVPHPQNLTPSWQGDSVGWYDGDTLVVDTIGIKAAPISTVDIFGTPHTEALHVIERYRLIDGEIAAQAQLRNGGTDRPAGFFYGRGAIDPDTAKKGLEVEFTVEDQGVFTTPWTGRVTYRRLIGNWPESVCAENGRVLGSNYEKPTADHADF